MFFCNYIQPSDVTFDPDESARNLVTRGLPFESAAEFELATAWVVIDDRKEYGEIRYRAIGLRNGRLHALVFTETPSGIRVISFRKADPREERRYDQVQTSP